MKKKKLLGKVLCLSLAGAMVLSLTSCKKNNGQTGGGNVSGLVAEAASTDNSKDAVFKFEKDFALPSNPFRVLRQGDQLICAYRYYDLETDMDGSDYGEIADETGAAEDTEEAVSETVSEETENAGIEDANTEDTNKDDADTENTNTEDAEDADSEDTDTEEADTDDSFDGDGGSGDNGEYAIAWTLCDVNGNVGETVVHKEKREDGFYDDVSGFALKDDGNLLAVVLRSDNTNNVYEIKAFTFSLDGKLISEQEVPNPGIPNIDTVSVAEDGTIVVFGDAKLSVIDKDLKAVATITTDKIEGYVRATAANDGKLYVSYYNDNYVSDACEVLLSEKKLGESLNIGNDLELSLCAADNHTFYSKNSTGMYAIDLNGSGAESKILLNYADSDISYFGSSGSFFIDDETAIILQDDDDPNAVSGLYKKVPPEEVKEKKIITLGSIYTAPYDVQKQVLAFNKTNDEYRIRMVNYEQYYDENDFLASERQFKNDILSKNGPDIIITSSMVNPGIYANKGVFADMYPYFEKNGINKDDYFTNILDAGSYDGKLYNLIPKFSIEYVAVKKSVMDGKTGLSVQDMMDLEEKYNCKGAGFPTYTRDSMLTYALAFTANSYFDATTGECNFESEDFINTLKWLKEYPEGKDEAVDYYEEMAKEETQLHKNEAVATVQYLYSLRDLYRTEQGLYGEEVAMMGFPGSKNPASGVISADIGFAISAQGENQDAAFEFIKTYLTEEYQMPDPNDSESYSIPLMKKAFDEKVKIESAKPFSYDEKTGKKTEYDDTTFSYVKNEEITVTAPSDGHKQEVKEFVENTSNFTSYDQKIQDIIKEEAAPFFEGQKSAEDAAKIIQSRVSIYVMESQ